MLEIRSLGCTIEDGENLFNEVSFTLRKAGTVAIEAGSGRGKSSLLFCIKGIFQKGKRFKGNITCDQRPLDPEERKAIGLVLQNPHSQMISTLVREELLFGSGKERQENNALFEETTAILGLDRQLEKSVRTLSAGQKHMVAIGAAGLMRCKVLLLDEPFLYLDPENISRVLKYIKYLQQQGTGIILTSHPGVVDTGNFDTVVSLSSPKTYRLKKIGSCFPPSKTAAEGRFIRLRQASFGHDNKQTLWENLNLTVTGGEELWVSGENGSGKTTLLKVLSGAMEPANGSVLRRGISGPCRISMITQNPDRFFFEATVIKEMASAVNKKRGDRALPEARQREIEQLLLSVGLGEKKEVSPFKLSFGEKVFLSAAQAWILSPDFLFVDDILGFLDGRERKFLLSFLRSLQKQTGCGLVFTSSRGIYASKDNPLLITLNRSGNRETTTPGEQDSGKKAKTSLFKKMLRALKTPAFEYVTVRSPLHRAHPLLKMGAAMAFWVALYQAGEKFYPHIAGILFLYYLSGRLGIGRFLADSRFFVFQALFFSVFLPVFRWDLPAYKEGFMAGIRVWLFFIPVIVMMRTTTVSDWMNTFSRFLSEKKRLALGISFGLLPCITADAGEIIHIQGMKGLLPEKRDLLRPRLLFYGLKSVFVPLMILVEDISFLAGLSVKLRGYED